MDDNLEEPNSHNDEDDTSVIVIDLRNDIIYHYLLRLRHHEDVLGIVLKGHLLIEYVLNKIIERQFRDSKGMLTDHRSFTFSVKLQMLYASHNLPEYLYRNIRNINKIRNQVAHNLDVDFDSVDFVFHKSDGETINLREAAIKRMNPTRYVVRLLCHGTLSELQLYYAMQFKELPMKDRDPYK
ncbi:MAG TPA: hypothetical protein VF952_13045 [Chloroflexia bacterium]|jgi:hypothetical protein